MPSQRDEVTRRPNVPPRPPQVYGGGYVGYTSGSTLKTAVVVASAPEECKTEQIECNYDRRITSIDNSRYLPRPGEEKQQEGIDESKQLARIDERVAVLRR